MELKEHTVTGSAEAVLTNDNQGIAFTLLTAHGPLARLKFKLDDVPEFIAHLCEVVRQVHPERRPSAAPVYVPASAARLGGCADPTIALFAFGLPGMDLGLSLSTETAADLAGQMARMAQTLRLLSASGPPL